MFDNENKYCTYCASQDGDKLYSEPHFKIQCILFVISIQIYLVNNKCGLCCKHLIVFEKSSTKK